MKLTMLGTGNAMVTNCYNTCFAFEEDGRCFLVDAGGDTILRRLREAGIDWKQTRDIFVTHKHIDHILGIVWMMRIFCQNMKRDSAGRGADLCAQGSRGDSAEPCSDPASEKSGGSISGCRRYRSGTQATRRCFRQRPVCV